MNIIESQRIWNVLLLCAIPQGPKSVTLRYFALPSLPSLPSIIALLDGLSVGLGIQPFDNPSMWRPHSLLLHSYWTDILYVRKLVH
jgi:hypothetical protein